MIEKQEVQEIFPTPLWIVICSPPPPCRSTRSSRPRSSASIEPRPKDPRRQQLADAAGPAHQARLRRVREAVETAARGVARFLQVDQYPMGITAAGPTSIRRAPITRCTIIPTTTLSGVYYVAVPTAGSQIISRIRAARRR